MLYPHHCSGDITYTVREDSVCVVMCYEAYNGLTCYPKSSGGSWRLGLKQAWVVARKCPSVAPPSFVPKMAEIDIELEMGCMN
jgi:hypothetical protein